MIDLLPLHHNIEYLDQAISILSQEWPRDDSLRRRTIQKSNDTFKPICLVLVNLQTKIVLGFVKLTGELPFGKSVFLESLVVHPHQRGKGYGRQILEMTETLIKKQNKFDRINLTTIDKVNFYLKMGYQLSFSSQEKPPPSSPYFSSAPKDTIQNVLSTQQILPLIEPLSLPPPPPPPLSAKPAKAISMNKKVFMWKSL